MHPRLFCVGFYCLLLFCTYVLTLVCNRRTTNVVWWWWWWWWWWYWMVPFPTYLSHLYGHSPITSILNFICTVVQHLNTAADTSSVCSSYVSSFYRLSLCLRQSVANSYVCVCVCVRACVCVCVCACVCVCVCVFRHCRLNREAHMQLLYAKTTS